MAPSRKAGVPSVVSQPDSQPDSQDSQPDSQDSQPDSQPDSQIPGLQKKSGRVGVPSDTSLCNDLLVCLFKRREREGDRERRQRGKEREGVNKSEKLRMNLSGS